MIFQGVSCESFRRNEKAFFTPVGPSVSKDHRCSGRGTHSIRCDLHAPIVWDSDPLTYGPGLLKNMLNFVCTKNFLAPPFQGI